MIIAAFIYTPTFMLADSEVFSKMELKDSFSSGLTNVRPSEIIPGQIQLEVKVVKVK